MIEYFDKDVNNDVYMEAQFPNLRYLKDGHCYMINNKLTLVIGGAYSPDKEWRLQNSINWFPQEQLSLDEMNSIKEFLDVYTEPIEQTFLHTCPLSLQPRHLFLSYIDQNKVDKTMENWLEQLYQSYNLGHIYFGHYHADEEIAPNATMLYKGIKSL